MAKLAGLGASLLVGFAVGFVVGKQTATPALDCTSPQSRTIIVRANGTLDCPTARIGMAHTVTWSAPAGTRLVIKFAEPSPFPQLLCYGNFRCDSYPVKSDLFGPTDPAEKEFSYTVSLNGGTPQPNGRIIIQK